MNSEQRADARRIMEELGTWPDDSYMERYMLSLESKFMRVRNKYKSSLSSNLDTKEGGTP